MMGMGDALQEALQGGIADKLDSEIMQGTNGLLTGTILDNHNVIALSDFDDFVRLLGFARVDGRYASSTGDLRLVMGTEAYAKAGNVYRNANVDRTALDRLMEVTGGVRVSAHVPASVSNKQNSLVRLGNRQDYVAPVWGAVTLIPDEITKAANGQIVLTAVLLHAAKLLRAGGWYKQQTQHA